MKRFWIRKAVMVVFFLFVGLTIFSTIVMSLWNAILPYVLHVNPITFWQALGILVLSKILFGGFPGRGGWGPGRHRWKQQMRERWKNMAPEQREKLKQHWKDRCCGGEWDKEGPASETSTERHQPGI